MCITDIPDAELQRDKPFEELQAVAQMLQSGKVLRSLNWIIVYYTSSLDKCQWVFGHFLLIWTMNKVCCLELFPQ